MRRPVEPKQYLWDEYIRLLEELGFHQLYSRKGNPYDNAWTESFMKTLKYDEIHMGEYETYLVVAEKLPEFIEEIYNKKRLRSSLIYLSLEEFENTFTGASHVNRPKLYWSAGVLLESNSLEKKLRPVDVDFLRDLNFKLLRRQIV